MIFNFINNLTNIERKIRKKKLILIFILILFFWLFFSIFSQMIFSKNLSFYIVKLFYGKVCHQIENRCFVILNSTMLICARCFGIYTGFLIIFILGFFEKFSLSFRKRNFFYFLFLPIIIDLIMEKVFYIDLTNTIRYFTGLLAAIPVAMHLFNSITMLENRKNE